MLHTDQIQASTTNTTVDLAHTGRLPYLVEQAQPHPDTEPTPCHLYPGLCTVIDGEEGDMVDENGRHYDHGGNAISVPGLEVEGDPEIWAEFTHISAGKPPHIGLMGFDLTPDQARVKAREMRQFADQLDNLADQVATARALHDVRTVRETAGPAFAEILTIVETAIVRDDADPTEVFDHVLKLMDQTSAAA